MKTHRTTNVSRPYLEETVALRVRFHEVDVMNIVWHGHYAGYFEEARRALGRRYDVDYPVFLRNNVVAPVVSLGVKFLLPARLDDTLAVTARFLKPENAKLEFDYVVRRGSEVLARGVTVQVFTTPDGELLLRPPPFMLELYRQWEPLWTRS